MGRRPEVHGLVDGNNEPHTMDMPSMQGGAAPADARDSDYSDGHAHGPMTGMDMQDNAARAMLLVDRIEYFDARASNGQAFEGHAWFGNDRDKLWISGEGERSDGALDHLRSELLWDHAVSAYWDTQLGVRHDSGVGTDRSWAAFGVHGLAPYWFEVSATAYVGQAGRTAFRAEAEYELLLTQRLILQPRFEVNLFGQNDPQRGTGSGLSDAALGVRLRYEVRREFAPYVGIEWIRKFGGSAGYARTALEPVFDRQIVAGIHFWL
ncbi:MAG: copper resistance protein B [Dokdonella sp.]